MNNFITPEQIPDGWRVLQNGELIQNGGRYFAEKAARTDEDYKNGSKIVERWDCSFQIGQPLSDKRRQCYIRKL